MQLLVFRLRLRFTPTCVGKTGTSITDASSIPVHPHVRGEDNSFSVRFGAGTGSPPRAWGRRRPRGESFAPRRFTPTCVGKTRCRSWCGSRPTVHPHVRGEDFSLAELRKCGYGSPPRAWGRRVFPSEYPSSYRFTPTCVGKTGRFELCGHRLPVHPHVRGEDLPTIREVVVALGSPPRAWGRPPCFAPYVFPTRFTPTCVGKTKPPCPKPCTLTVHPHVRGEDVKVS